MATNNAANISQTGLEAFSTNQIVGRTIATGTSNQFLVTNGDGTGGDPTISFDTQRILNTQPAFLAQVSGTITDVTGNATAYTVLYDNEIFDQAGNYNPATGLFHAPVAGKYHFCCVLTLSGILVTHTLTDLNFVAISNYQYRAGALFTILDASGLITVKSSVTLNLNSGTNVSTTIQINGGTKVVDVIGNNNSSWFCGYLCL